MTDVITNTIGTCVGVALFRWNAARYGIERFLDIGEFAIHHVGNGPQELSMLINRIYYSVKRFIPYRLRLKLRRSAAKSKRLSHADVWPIDPKAGATPPGWPGWPDGKKFAFVLTHDVEGPIGVSRVEQLMKLEMEHGFRSSFNFVPEGEFASRTSRAAIWIAPALKSVCMD